MKDFLDKHYKKDCILNVDFQKDDDLLNYFFLLKTDKIVLNPELSKEEIRKLQKMVNEGYQHSIKINIGNSKK
ncbi:MAG: hypothetical protein LBE92_01190 [Chryseobacterium sp.]|jgi:hypothetical protein|uniref:hypothetical protein n=1 Tax=Chryseobacterium sp. TaxID=1871047 RepID=UPI0028248ECD|nr:hypothetical protein [Chryseobacterium sp.]MDR2234713.1 hypothetical protein [Chryseobacterium sp.]